MLFDSLWSRVETRFDDLFLVVLGVLGIVARRISPCVVFFFRSLL